MILYDNIEDAQFNVDRAVYIGDAEDGVYYEVYHCRDGWYVTVVVDCDTSGFTEAISEGEGPYDSVELANEAGRNDAIDWCVYNGVEWEPTPLEQLYNLADAAGRE